MKCINFGQINKKLLIPVISGVITLIYRYIIKYNPKYKIATQNPFLLNAYVAFGMILAIIPYLILKQRSKQSFINSEELQDKSKLEINLLYNKDDIFKKTKFAKYRFIVYSTVFDFTQTLLSTLYCSFCVYNLWIFDIIFISLFSYLMLKAKLYRHQYISMIIIITLGFGLNVIEYFKLDETEKGLDPLEISMKFVSEICLSLSLVIIKYNMEKNYCNPYEVSIWEGVIGFFLNIICLVAFNLSGSTINGTKYPDNIKEYFDDFDYNDFIVCFAIIIVHFFYNIFLFLTCNYLTPCHILISSIIRESYLYLQPSDNVSLNIIGFVILVFIAFLFLIFIEIIEINIFNISFNTKKNIEIRSRKESLVEFNDIIPSNEEVKTDEQEKINSSFSSNNSENL